MTEKQFIILMRLLLWFAHFLVRDIEHTDKHVMALGDRTRELEFYIEDYLPK